MLIILGGILGVYALYKMLYKPLLGVALVIVVTPLEPIFINVVGFAIGRYLGTVTILFWIIYLAKNDAAILKLNHSTLLRKQLYFLIPVLISASSWYLEPDGQRAINGAFTFVLLGLMALMVENLTMTKKDVVLISIALLIAGVLASIPANLYFLGYDLYTPLGVVAPTEETEETLRATTLGGNPNSLGILTRNGIFASVFLITYVRKFFFKTTVWIMLLICFSGIVLSGSRTNFYGAIFMILFLLLFGFSKFIFRRKQIFLMIGGFVIIGYAGFLLVPELVQKRLFMGSDDKHITERSENRIEFTQMQQKQSIEFLRKNPLLGIGLDRTYYETGHDLGAHDTVSVLVGETGLLGTIGFIYLFLWALYRLKKIRDYSSSVDSKIRFTLLIGLLVSMLIMGIFGGFIIPYDRTFWMTLAFIYPISEIEKISQLELDSGGDLYA